MPADDGFGVDRLAPTIRTALQGKPPSAIGLVVALGGMAVSDLAFNLRHSLDVVGAVTVALATQVVVGVLLVAATRSLRRVRVGPGVRPVLVAAVFIALGVVRTSMLVLGNPHPSWALWLQQLLPRAVGAGVWFAVSAVLVESMQRAGEQRMRLETAYRQLLVTRTDTAAALARTEAELAEVTAATRAAISEIRRRLHAGITVAELDECIERVERLVDREVRPSSHQLAQAPIEVPSAPVPSLWPTTAVRIGAMVRRWPTARPFQPVAAALAALPTILAQIAVTPPDLRGPLAGHSFVGLAVQVGALAVAALLSPLLKRMPWRVAVACTFATYAGLYALGIAMLVRDANLHIEVPLTAHIFPSVFALIAGGASAAAAQHRAESAAATRVVALIGRSLSRTRQQLWARRHRLALALHGRVQANLTAAGLLLGRVRDEFVLTGKMDLQLIRRVREAMQLAWQVDSRNPGSARDRLLRVTGVWSGIMEVSLELSDRAEQSLDADEDSADACVEVVREVLLNGARHGGATSAEVSIRSADPDLVRVRVRESGGRPADRRSGTGLGGTMIGAVSSHWWVHRDGTDRVTSLLLPTGLATGTFLPEPAEA